MTTRDRSSTSASSRAPVLACFPRLFATYRIRCLASSADSPCEQDFGARAIITKLGIRPKLGIETAWRALLDFNFHGMALACEYIQAVIKKSKGLSIVLCIMTSISARYRAVPTLSDQHSKFIALSLFIAFKILYFLRIVRHCGFASGINPSITLYGGLTPSSPA